MSLERRVEMLEDRLDQIGEDVREIKNTVVRSKGFIAGVMFVVVPAWGAVVALCVYIWNSA